MRIEREAAEITDETQRAAKIAAIEAEIEEAKRKALEAGGLFVVGSERHESRRIDNQLRGRSGRQGDPGASKFFLSLEDDLMRIFGSERMDSMLQRSEEHTSELQSLMRISYAVFCLKKKKQKNLSRHHRHAAARLW